MRSPDWEQAFNPKRTNREMQPATTSFLELGLAIAGASILTFGEEMKYPYIRNQLESHLHQDYDLDSGTAPDAIIKAIRESDLPKLLSELNALKSESDETVFEVLNDHSVDIWQRVGARDLLCAMLVLTELFDEERLLAKKNKNTEQDVTPSA